MAWSGGTFTRANGSTEWQDDAALGIGIEAAIHDAQDNDLATGINNCLTKDGQNTPTANLPMGGYKHTGVANASGSGQYTTYNQLQDSSFDATVAQVAVNNTSTNAVVAINKYGADATPAFLAFKKSRGATVGSNTIVAANDVIGSIDFNGNNGTDFIVGARIRATVETGVGTGNDMPCGLGFSTTPDGSGTAATRMHITSAGRIGIGRTDPETITHIYAADPILTIQDSATSIALADARLRLAESDGSGNVENYWDIHYDGGPLTFNLVTTEVARFDASGNLLIGTTTYSGFIASNTPGVAIGSTGDISLTAAGAAPLYVNRKTNDGNLQVFYQDGVQEGAISVAGNTVTYGAFCGSHWTQLSDNSKPNIPVGTVMQSINELCSWPGEVEERLPKVKISDTVKSKAVYGVFLTWDNDWTDTNDMSVASLGAYFVRVPAGTVLQIGDLLESAGNGMAQVQADDVIRSSTIGKVTALTQSHIEADGSFCIPTVLYCG